MRVVYARMLGVTTAGDNGTDWLDGVRGPKRTFRARWTAVELWDCDGGQGVGSNLYFLLLLLY